MTNVRKTAALQTLFTLRILILGDDTDIVVVAIKTTTKWLIFLFNLKMG